MPCHCSEGNDMSKPRLTVYLSDSVADRLALACKRPGANKSKLVDSALDRYLNSQGNSSSDASLLRRLDHMSKQITKLDRNASVILETLGLFVRYYLIITPPLPKSEQDPARSMGNQRFEFFVTQIGKRLAAGQSLVRDVMELVSTNDPDLFARDLDETGFQNGAASQTTATPSASHQGRRGGEAPVPSRKSHASPAPGASTLKEDNHG
jgi:hypothetical protein